MDNFEVPKIPKIYVPQNIIPLPLRSESQTSSTKSYSKRAKEANSPESDPEDSVPNTNSSAPKLCASCSQILLKYLSPLQRYVNEFVQIARGDSEVTASPLADLFNAQLLKSPNEIPTDDHSHGHTEHFHSGSAHQREEQTIARQEHRLHYSGGEGGHHYSGPRDGDSKQSQHQSHSIATSVNRYHHNDQGNYGRHEEHHGQHDHYVHGPGHERPHQTHDGMPPDGRSAHTSGESEAFVGREANQTKAQTDYRSHRHVVPSNDGPQEEANVVRDSQYGSPPLTNRPENIRNESSGAQDMSRDDESGLSCPFAFVTIAYNNLSATNAIILANSLVLKNNKSMIYTDSTGNRVTLQIPFIILIGGNIDPVLKDAIYMIFDEVISQPMDVKVALLSDQSFGIRQNKLQLWKELQNYEKCLFLESSTLVVARVTNLFEECRELSACVDWLFPDNFNCSVFVFEPSLTTYEQIISFALFHQKCSAQKDEGIAETLDEMTLLNQFFAPKWNRMSFVYNFVKNDTSYTQIPAFMKYGDSIRIVNFGHMMNQSSGLSVNPSTTSVQPWHLMFDLLASGQQDVVEAMPVDNFSKFYLNCFIQRLWPILQKHLTPLLVTKYGIGRREWSIFDLIRLLTNESGIETDDHMFTQTPITFRRIKSQAEKIAKYDALTIEEDEDLSENIRDLEIDFTNVVSLPSNDQQVAGDERENKERLDLAQSRDMSRQEQDERSKSEWEAGRIDWMGAHQSDRIISRLKKIIRND